MLDSREKSDTQKNEYMTGFFAWLIVLPAILVLGVFFMYLWNFPWEFSKSSEKWGQFGDYFGGTLNPLLSYLSLIALVLTLALQRRQLNLTQEEVVNSRLELEATREELKKSAAAQALTAEALSAQTQYAATSARLAALSAALSVTQESIKLLRQAQTGVNTDVGFYEKLRELKAQRSQISNKIIEISKQLTSGS